MRERADRAALIVGVKKLAHRLVDASLAAVRKGKRALGPLFHMGAKLQHYFFEAVGAGEIVLSHI